MEQVKKIYGSLDTIVWFVVVFVIIALIGVPNFATAGNITNILGQACVLLTVACGLHFSVLNGGVDFSCTSIIALTCVVGASIMSKTSGLLAGKWYAIPVAIIAMLLIGLIFGMINGFAVTTFKMPSFIVTMATQMIGSGLAVVYTGGTTISGLPEAFTVLGTGQIMGIPFALFLALLVAVVTHIVCSRTLYGRQLYSVGTNPKASIISGVPVKKTIFKIFLYSGVCAAVAGIIMMAQMESGASSYGSTLFIDIMGSIIVGGTSPMGGSGKIPNTVLGAFLIILINVTLNLLNTPYFIITIIKGAIILVAGGMGILKKRNEKE